MSIRVLAIAAIIAGCTKSAHLSGDATDCATGENCIVAGLVASDSPWEAMLKVEAGCIALALPEDYRPSVGSLANRSVKVSGFAMSQPEMFGDEYFYEVEGRRVNRNNCRFVLIVESIYSADGNVLWAD
jgi:hypothetical protein